MNGTSRSALSLVAAISIGMVVVATAADGTGPVGGAGLAKEPGGIAGPAGNGGTEQTNGPLPQPILLQGASNSGLPPQLTTAGDMIGFSRELGDGLQAITLINASRRWMAVYHINAEGQIRLASSRPLDADFSIQFNATSPLPDEIRRLQGK